jgi:hypothetical protein
LCVSGSALASIVNLSTSTVLYSDDFEGYSSVSNAAFPDNSGDYDPTSPTAGSSSAYELYQYDVQVTKHVGGEDPGAHQGTNYLRLNNNAYNDDAALNINIADQNTTGDVVRLEQMFYVPVAADGIAYFAALGSGTAIFNIGTQSTGRMRYLDYTTMTQVETTVPYTAGTWQKWAVDYKIGDATLTLSVDGNSQVIPTSWGTGGNWDFLQIAQGRYLAGVASIYVDAVPEPSTSAMAIAGLMGLLAYAWRKRH